MTQSNFNNNDIELQHTKIHTISEHHTNMRFLFLTNDEVYYRQTKRQSSVPLKQLSNERFFHLSANCKNKLRNSLKQKIQPFNRSFLFFVQRTPTRFIFRATQKFTIDIRSGNTHRSVRKEKCGGYSSQSSFDSFKQGMGILVFNSDSVVPAKQKHN